jgi:hypothetical protein
MEPRKASEILLEIESKIDLLIKAIAAQNQSTITINNKLNKVIKTLSNVDFSAISDSENDIPEFVPPSNSAVPNPEFSFDPIPIETESIGFPRTSRPETYASQKQINQVNRKIKKVEEIQVPTPAAPLPKTKRPVQGSNDEEWRTVSSPALPTRQSEENANIGKVSVSQRVVDRNSKAIFLANVEILEKKSEKLEAKTRTTSDGKWQAVLPPGTYNVVIKKTESMSKQKVELTQEIVIDGRNPSVALPMVIAK